MYVLKCHFCEIILSYIFSLDVATHAQKGREKIFCEVIVLSWKRHFLCLSFSFTFYHQKKNFLKVLFSVASVI